MNQNALSIGISDYCGLLNLDGFYSPQLAAIKSTQTFSKYTPPLGAGMVYVCPACVAAWGFKSPYRTQWW